MRLSIPISALRAGGTEFSSNGGTLTSGLYLFRNPVEQLEATTKSYIDTAITSISANFITTGTISAQRFPIFTGDIENSAGSGIINLISKGITPGAYTKVVTDNKGLITSVGNLTSDDIPSFSWNKIINGKPSTLSGFGISEGLNKNGDILTGYLDISNQPTETLHIANKNYVDSNLSEIIGFMPGDIESRTSSITPVGFLRCNGGEISKTTYSVLYSVIGDLYNYSNQPGSGKPWKQQYDFNIEQNLDITNWTSTTNLPGTLQRSQAIVTKNRVYLLGGFTSTTTATSTVYTASINADGTLGAWTTGTSLPGALGYSQAIVTKNRVYLLGGYDNTTGFVSKVYTAPINSDGTLGTWTTDVSLPDVLIYSEAIVTRNRVYLLGGHVIGNSISTIYTAPINADGTLGTWSVDNSLPVALGYSQAIVTKSRVYLLGGYVDDVTDYILSTVYTAPINSDGTLGTWVAGTSLPVTLYSGQTVVTKNRVYLLGGYTDTGLTSGVYTAPINEDGTLGTWSVGTSLLEVLQFSQVITTNSRIYLLGGSNNSGITSKIYSASFTGGLNDYSSYYDGTIIPTNPDNFKLPDFTSKETNNFFYFIKY